MDRDSMARDVAFLRDAVGRTGRTPASVWFLWAVIVGAGGVVVDRWPEASLPYWVGAVAVGVIGSVLLGWRRGLEAGAIAKRVGLKTTLHWVAVSVVVFAAMALAVNAGMRPESLGALAFLLVALGYFLAGVHLDRSAWGPAAVALGGCVALVLHPGSWLAIGLACGLGLAVVGVLELRSRERVRG